MDRHEAMLRELNLYPVWVRRDAAHNAAAPEPQPAEQSAAPELRYAEHPAAPEPLSAGAPAVATPALQDAQPEPLSIGAPVVAGTSNEPAADLFVAASEPADAAAADTLREFQLQNQGGALGHLSCSELQQKVRECELCGLSKTRTQTVFGAGNLGADWLFVGEAPGQDEDASGEPFTGHAGRLLDNMLLSIGITRPDVYIANVIKCRPPEDRSPHVGEISSCLPYLRRQIDLVRPRIIVALGKTAACALLGTDATIGSLRGRVHEYRGIPLVATFHPAYLLRSPQEKARAWQDLLLAAGLAGSADAPC